MIVGKTAIKITPKHITQSKLTQESETASSPLPFVIDISEQIGRIKVKSIIFAPSIFPAESEPDFFFSAVRAVTSSGREVPIATAITLITLCEIFRLMAICVAYLTRSFAPNIMPTAPKIKRIMQLTFSFVQYDILLSSLFVSLFMHFMFSKINIANTVNKSVTPKAERK